MGLSSAGDRAGVHGANGSVVAGLGHGEMGAGGEGSLALLNGVMGHH